MATSRRNREVVWWQRASHREDWLWQTNRTPSTL